MNSLLSSFLTPAELDVDFDEHPDVVEFMHAQNPTLEQTARAYMIRDCSMSPNETIGHFRDRTVAMYQEYADGFADVDVDLVFLEVARENPNMIVAEAMHVARERAHVRAEALVNECQIYINRIRNLPYWCSPYDVYLCFSLNELLGMGW